MSREVFVVERRKDRSGWLILLGVVLVIAFWKYIIFGAICAGIYMLGQKARKVDRAYRDRKISRDAATALRADYENMMALRDDPVGYEGRYPCSTMPILPGYSFDNYDDGLKDWK